MTMLKLQCGVLTLMLAIFSGCDPARSLSIDVAPPFISQLEQGEQRTRSLVADLDRVQTITRDSSIQYGLKQLHWTGTGDPEPHATYASSSQDTPITLSVYSLQGSKNTDYISIHIFEFPSTELTPLSRELHKDLLEKMIDEFGEARLATKRDGNAYR